VGRERVGCTIGNTYEEKRGIAHVTGMSILAYQGGHCITLESLEPSSLSVACWVGGPVSGTFRWPRFEYPFWCRGGWRVGNLGRLLLLYASVGYVERVCNNLCTGCPAS